jgi:RimJ/RimL family protein N-acetyltransferase
MDDAAAWISHCAEGWRSGEHFAFAILDSRSHDFIGATGLNQRNRLHNLMNLGYWVRASRQRRGVAVRASTLVAQFGFRQAGLMRIEIFAEVGNVASRRVAEARAHRSKPSRAIGCTRGASQSMQQCIH